MMEADIIHTDVLRWTGHRRGRNRPKEKKKNTFILTTTSNIGMMSP